MQVVDHRFPGKGYSLKSEQSTPISCDLPLDILRILFSHCHLASLESTVRVSRDWSKATVLTACQILPLKDFSRLKIFATKELPKKAELENMEILLITESLKKLNASVSHAQIKASLEDLYDTMVTTLRNKGPLGLEDLSRQDHSLSKDFKNLFRMAILRSQLDQIKVIPNNDTKWDRMGNLALHFQKENRWAEVMEIIEDMPQGRIKDSTCMTLSRSYISENCFDKALLMASFLSDRFVREGTFLRLCEALKSYKNLDETIIYKVLEVTQKARFSAFIIETLSEVIAKTDKPLPSSVLDGIVNILETKKIDVERGKILANLVCFIIKRKEIHVTTLSNIIGSAKKIRGSMYAELVLPPILDWLVKQDQMDSFFFNRLLEAMETSEESWIFEERIENMKKKYPAFCRN